MGDFNDVREVSERLISEFVESNAEAFSHFILSAGLHEYNMGGGRFTYISDKGDKLSKSGFSMLGVHGEMANRLFISSGLGGVGPPPSRFEHGPFGLWAYPIQMLQFMVQMCNSFHFSGPEDLALAIKLRWLKKKIKTWIKEDKSRTEGEYWANKKRVADFDKLAQDRLLVEEELNDRAECKQAVAEYERLKHMDIRQKSTIRWALEGDQNSAFYHGIINSNISNNRVNGLMVDGSWITNPVAIKECFYDFLSCSVL
ncbi:uncharacterized protein LOC110932317 [Helianthus annuus]|uniref:uncharacterized protein LOC110932317 n=1 Tax=Helianthus annuus TaxID=4232 RepID=UPI000B90075A|nr:uncharacterized protein LOC110932317 [Helianthus annuus]